jgi:hypothetical protein
MSYRWLALITSPIALLLISATRLLIVSDYSTTTAVTVASSGGYVNTLVGTIIPLLPIFLPYIALALLLFRQFFLSIVAFIFTLFVTPTPLRLPRTKRLAEADIHQFLSYISHQQGVSLIVAATLFLLAWAYYKNIADAVSVLIIVLVVSLLVATPYLAHLRLPSSLAAASADERHLYTWVISDTPRSILIAVVIIVAVGYNNVKFSGFMSSLIALAATILLVPYVLNIYQVPKHSNYYASVLYQPWLPAEAITLTTGTTYYGYVLNNDTDWFTVLLAKSRTVAYFPTDEVAGRAVCREELAGQPQQKPPLIALLYRPPTKHITICRA